MVMVLMSIWRKMSASKEVAFRASNSSQQVDPQPDRPQSNQHDVASGYSDAAAVDAAAEGEFRLLLHLHHLSFAVRCVALKTAPLLQSAGTMGGLLQLRRKMTRRMMRRMMRRIMKTMACQSNGRHHHQQYPHRIEHYWRRSVTTTTTMTTTTKMKMKEARCCPVVCVPQLQPLLAAEAARPWQSMKQRVPPRGLDP